MTRAFLLAGLTLALGACAAAGPSRYQSELDRLAADCAARGGILTPSGMRNTGNPAVDNACSMPGGRISR